MTQALHTFRKSQLTNLIFVIGYAFLIAVRFFSQLPFISQNENIFNLIICLLLGLVIILQSDQYRKKSFAIVLILALLSVITTYFTQDYSVLKFVLVIAAAKHIRFRRFIKYDLYIRLALLIGVIIFNRVGLIESILIPRSDLVRDSLGFSHPNYLGIQSLVLILEYLYLKKFQLSLTTVILPLLVTILLALIADSRTSEYLLLASIAFITIHHFAKGRILQNRLVQNFITYLPIILTTLSLLALYIFNAHPDFGTTLNRLVSGRLYYANFYTTIFDFNLFGNDIYANTNQYPLDIAYIHIALHFGVIFFTILILAYTVLLKRLYQTKNYSLIYIMTCFLILGLTENSFLRIENNAFMLLFATLLWQPATLEESNEK